MHPNLPYRRPHGSLKFSTIATLVVIAIMAPLLIAACGDDEVVPTNTPEPTAMAPEPTEATMMDEKMAMPNLAFPLGELNDSGQTGWASLVAKGGQTEVVLALNPGTAETELVHIHDGQCGDTLGGVAHALNSFTGGAGSSVTTVDVSLDSLRTGGFAVNAHTKGDPGVYTACGNIPAEGSAVTFSLGELNDSGQTGWASLTARGNQTDVILSLSPGSSESELVHIHTGQFDTLGGVAHGLSSFTGGAGVSVTTVDASLDSVRTGGFAVNAHTKGEPGVYTACGNIPVGPSAAMMDEKAAMPALAIALGELNESGQNGWALLTAKGGQTEVVLALNPGTVETELVHIHEGQCGDTLGGVSQALSSFADGAGPSMTVVDATLDSLLTGAFAINAHMKENAGVYNACGNIPAKGSGVTFSLGELNDSGQTGWASLTARGDQTEVILSLSPGSSESELVHIHTGQCDTLGGVAHGLSSFTGGAGVSVTTVDASLDSVRTGGVAVNAHTKGEPGVYTACGNIPAGPSAGY